MDYSQSRSKYLQIMFENMNNEISQVTQSGNTINAVGDNSYEDVEIARMQKNNELAIQQAQEQQQEEKKKPEINNAWDFLKASWNTISGVVNDITEGILNFGDDIFDLAINASGEIGSWFGADKSWTKDITDYDWQAVAMNKLNPLSENFILAGGLVKGTDNWTNWNATENRLELEKKQSGSFLNYLPDNAYSMTRGITQSIGYMLPSLAVGTALGEVGSLATMGAGAFAGTTSDAYKESGNFGLSALQGLASAAVEVGTELVVGPLLSKAGVGTGKVMGVIGAKGLSQGGKSFIKTLAKTMFEEGVEEAVSGILNPLVNSITQGKDALVNENGQSVYFDKDFWLGGNDSVLGQFTAGALTSAILGGPSQITMHKRFGSNGIQIVELLQDNYELNNKLKSIDKNSTKYQSTLEQIAMNTCKITGLYNQMSEAGVKESKHLLNTQKLLMNPTELDFIKQNSKSGKELKENFTNFITNRLNEMQDPDKYLTRNVFDELQEKYGTNFRLEFSDDLASDTHGTIDFDNHVITLNNAYSNQYASTLAHEYFGHALSLTMSESERNALVSKIHETEWFKKNESKLNDAYKDIKDDTKAFNTEIINKYIEQLFAKKGDNTKALKALEDVTLRNKLLHRFIALFNKKSNLKMLKNDTILKEFIDISNLFTDRMDINNSILKKISDDKAINTDKFTKEELEFYKEHEDMYKVYLDAVLEIESEKENSKKQNSKELEGETKNELVKKNEIAKKPRKKRVKANKVISNDVYEVEYLNGTVIYDSANEKLGRVVLVRDGKIAYDQVENIIEDALGIEIDIEDKKSKAKRLFQDFNLLPNSLKEACCAKFITDLLKQKVNVEKPSNNKTTKENINGELVDETTEKPNMDRRYTLEELLKEDGYDIETFTTNFTKLLYETLNAQGKPSKVSQRILKLLTTIEELKQSHKAVVAFLKTTNSIKNKLSRIVKKYGNTGQLELDTGVKGLYYSFFSKFRFTKTSYLSNSNMRILKQLVIDGTFDKLVNTLLNPNNELGDDVLQELNMQAETIKQLAHDLADTYDMNATRMSTPQVIEFTNLVKGLYKLYNDFNGDVLEQTRKEAGTLIKQVKEVSQMHNKGKAKGLKNKVLGFIMNYCSPRTIFAYITGGSYTDAYDTLYNELYKKPYENQVGEYVKFMKLFHGENNENIKTILKNGNQKLQVDGVTIRRYALYQFYLNSLSPDNVTRMENSNLTYTDKTKSDISYQAMQEAVSQLSETETSELDAIFELYNNEVKEYVEKSSEKILGFKVSRENYYPIVASESAQIKDLTNSNQTRYNINALDNGRLKKLTNTKTKIELNINPISLFQDYIESMTITGEIGLASQKLNRLLQLKVDNVNALSVISEYIPNSNTYIKSMFNKLIGNTSHIQRNGFFDKMIGRFATARLGLNISSMLKQIGSYFTAWSKVGVIPGIKTTLNLKHYARLKQNAKYLQENNKVFQNRIFEHGYVRASTLTESKNKLVNATMKGIEWMDRMTCYATFALCQESIKKQYGYEIGSEENLKLANDMFTDMILETQSNADRIAMSRVRSGERGWLIKNLFGLFQSDAQNKFDLLLNLMMDEQSINYELKKLTDINDHDKSKRNKLTSIKKANHKKGRAIGAGLLLSASVEVMVGLLIKWLYDREEPEDTELVPVMTDLFMATCVDYIPVLSQFINWFEYGGIDVPGVDTINSLIETAKTFFDEDASPTKKDYTNLVVAVAEFFGIPLGNAKNIAMGIIGNWFDPELALKANSFLYGVSQTNLSRKLNEQIEKGDIGKAKATLGFNYDLYKFSLSEDALSEFIYLRANNVKVSAKNIPSTYTNEKGEETALTDEQKTEFKKIYSESNNALELLIRDNTYSLLSNEDKGKAIKKITDLYFDIANNKVGKVEIKSKLAKLYAASKGKMKIEKYVPIMVYLNTYLQASKDKKTTLMRLLNTKFRTLTKAEKLIVSYLLGYNLSQDSESIINSYIKKLSK